MPGFLAELRTAPATVQLNFQIRPLGWNGFHGLDVSKLCRPPRHISPD
jgi:hypothetical protein